jgi:membrane-bound lytic murein transglycosylase F
MITVPDPRHRPRRPPLRAYALFFAPLILAAAVAAEMRLLGWAWPPPDREPVWRGPPYIETGDLPALRARGVLRLLVERIDVEYLPRDVDPLFQARELVRDFAAQVGVRAELVPVGAIESLIPALLEGRGDLISENLVVTEDRRERVAFSLPLARSRLRVVTRVEAPIETEEQLGGRVLAVRPGTPSFERALELRERVPELRIQALPAELSRDEILDAVAEGVLDATVEDGNVVEVELDYRPELVAPLAVGEERAVAWAVRPDSPQLLGALNSFLQQQWLARERDVRYTEDLPGLVQRRRLRLLTRNTTASYFLWRGELRGFEYELAREFARRHRMRVEVVVAERHDQLIPMLLEGRGDVVAAFLTPTEARRQRGVAFSRPYHFAVQQVVARAGEPVPGAPVDLAGRTLVLRKSSAYWETAEALQRLGVGVRLEAAPEDLDVEGIVARVASGEYDLTIADSHLLELELSQRRDVVAAFDLGEPDPHAWAVREQDRELLAAIDAFWAEEYRGPLYNVVYRRYFGSADRIRVFRRERAQPAGPGRFTEWDETVKRHAREYGLDWRLIMAVMYQESRFDPGAVSWAGARGLLQVMPRTAADLGFTELDRPEVGIHAGVRYLAWLRDQFDPTRYAEDRIWFALAAYNTGLGHVLDARRVARQLGWNDHRWFGHVERAMLLLSRPEYARHARHGYLSGGKPVAYVRGIRDRYGAYIHLTAQWERGPAPGTPAPARTPAKATGIPASAE